MSKAQPEQALSFAPLRNWYLWLGVTLAAVLPMIAVFRDGLVNIASHWQQEEYSHGYLIPVIALLMAWRQRGRLSAIKPTGSWAGLVLMALGLLFSIAGELSTLYVIIHFGFLVTFVGWVWASLGWRGLIILWAPLVFLAFMVPVPDILFNRLSLELQLISSQWGVWVIRQFGIPVFLDGNVIDLGVYKLLVVEACSGLRYLFPLMSFGFIVAYLFRIPVWQKAVLFVSTVPLTIIMNSLRIGIVGILVEHYGVEMAKGFIHDFEGWAIFMACVSVLFLEAWLLTFLIRPRPALMSLLDREFLNIIPDDWPRITARPPLQCLLAIALLVATAVGVWSVGERPLVHPERRSFATFPLKIGDWYGERGILDKSVIAAIKVDDFVIANYRRLWDREAVQFYTAYYASQQKGSSVHSPEACLPGGGWEIVDIGPRTMTEGVEPMVVNRAVIQKGLRRQLVYYWFNERGRVLNSSLAVKWYLLWDALNLNRTDGALVRLITMVPEGSDIIEADRRLTEYLTALQPELSPYLPQR